MHTTIFLHNALKGSGKVVRLDERFDSDGNSFEFAPVIRFGAVDGKTYTVTSAIATNPPGFAPGDIVEVDYSKNDPGGARIASSWQAWSISIVLAIIGIAHGLIGGLILFAERKTDRRVLLPARQIN